MLLEKNILGCVSTDTTRWAICHVYVDVQEKVAVATDGRLMAVIPINPEPDEVSGYVPREALLAAAKLPKSQKRYQILHYEKETVVEGTRFPNPFAEDAGPPTFPDWRNVMPKCTDAPITCFNGALVDALATAINPTGKIPAVSLTLDLAAPLAGPMLLRPSVQYTPSNEDDRDWSRARGVLMPVRCDEVRSALTANTEVLSLRARIHDLTAALAEAHAKAQPEAIIPAPVSPVAEMLEKLQGQYAAMEKRYRQVVSEYETIKEDYDILLQDLNTYIQNQPSESTRGSLCMTDHTSPGSGWKVAGYTLLGGILIIVALFLSIVTGYREPRL